MRWTTWIGVAAGLLGLTGCYYGYRTVALDARYSTASRPHASYFCYDCHGYRYFDPYYDWCARYGFRYRWTAHPQVVHLYRERYVRIRERHPEYGSYRYRPGYKSSTRYRQGLDYESWKSGDSRSSERQRDVKRGDRKSPASRGERKGERPRERQDRERSKERRSGRGGSES
jgi:hypothetical protein